MTPIASTPKLPLDDGASSGFSLVDILVALVLLSVVAGLMAAFIGQFRTITRLQTDISARVEMNALVSYLEGTIGSALPMTFIENQADRRFSFEGTASRVRFVTIARQGVKAFGLRETDISLDGGGELKALQQRFSPRRLDPNERAAATSSISLAENIASLKLQYLSYDQSTFAPLWTDEWVARTGLPAAVRFEVRARRDGKMLTASGYAILKLSTTGQVTPRLAAGT